jgi:glycosyltransferase involved in cell wall biosynthesis
LEEAAVFDLMAGAEAVLVPSEWYEGLPLVILRSLAVGTPVIVSNLDNISVELLEDGAGASFKVADASSLSHVLSDVASSPQLWAARRVEARASYEARYSPAVDLHRLETVYDEVKQPRVTALG